ncbi:hypothetical protein [Methanolapillus ohkumae]
MTPNYSIQAIPFRFNPTRKHVGLNRIVIYNGYVAECVAEMHAAY